MTSKRCYLVCSTVPLYTHKGTVAVSHYVGTTKQPALTRLLDHIACGKQHSPHAPGELCSFGAARIAAAFVRAGGSLSITRIWAGGYPIEKRIKAYGKMWQLCPKCNKSAMKRKPKGLKKGQRIK